VLGKCLSIDRQIGCEVSSMLGVDLHSVGRLRGEVPAVSLHSCSARLGSGLCQSGESKLATDHNKDATHPR
jgi:hypothetical protein